MVLIQLSAWSAITLLSVLPKIQYTSPTEIGIRPFRRPDPPVQERLFSSFTSTLCSRPIPHAHTLDWSKMLGHWYLESATLPTGEPSRCVRQTFDQVDKRFGLLQKTMLIVPPASVSSPPPDSAQQQPPLQSVQLRTMALFDAQSDPNTLVSVFEMTDGEKMPIETIILETDYTSYIVGYECSGRADDGSAFEHMAIMTRTPTPLSSAQHAQLVRRAFQLIPPTVQRLHKFYQVSKAGCDIADDSSTDKRDVVELLPHEAYIDPKIFNTRASRSVAPHGGGTGALRRRRR